MNTKSLVASLMIIAIVVSSAQALVIKNSLSHKKSVQNAKTFALGAAHMLDDSVDAAAAGFMIELFAFTLDDADIMNSINNHKDLSAGSVAKLKQFFKDSPSFNAFTLGVMSSEESPSCFRSLSDDQKKKIINISIDQMDFSKFLSGDDTKSDNGVDKRTEDAIANDSSLGSDVAKCFHDNADLFNKLA